AAYIFVVIKPICGENGSHQRTDIVTGLKETRCKLINSSAVYSIIYKLPVYLRGDIYGGLPVLKNDINDIVTVEITFPIQESLFAGIMIFLMKFKVSFGFYCPAGKGTRSFLNIMLGVMTFA